jgi:hypothetical protein
MSELALNYVLVDEIRDDEGLVATITSRDIGGYRRLSFRIQKEYSRPPGGPLERTDFLRADHVAAARRLLDRVEERLRIEQDRINVERRGTPPAAVRGRR